MLFGYHGQPWLTMVDYKCIFLPFLSENPMAEPWSAYQAGTSTLSIREWVQGFIADMR